MKNRDLIRTATDEKLANLLNDLISGTLCRHYCKGCKESKYDCQPAVIKFLNSEVQGND